MNTNLLLGLGLLLLMLLLVGGISMYYDSQVFKTDKEPEETKVIKKSSLKNLSKEEIDRLNALSKKEKRTKR
jgi:tRNA A37 N6-isopentenylltransferase MiaA